MSQVGVLHDKAMKLAQLAMIAREQGEPARSETLAREACDYEMRAAELIPLDSSSEPTRSILYRSAASLACQARDFTLALRLVGMGLAGYPPKRVKDEMLQLVETVRFEEYLEKNQASLASDDLQLVMYGSAVGLGTVPYQEFIKRINNIPPIINKTLQRLMKRPYTPGGRIPEKYRRITPAICIPQPGSFSIAVKLMVAKGQVHQVELTDASPERIINEVLTGFEYINNSDIEGLREHINDEAYFRHFLHMAKNMAPDGDQISCMGLVSSKNSVKFAKVRTEIDIPPGAAAEVSDLTILNKDEPIDVIGELDFAVNRREKFIGLTAEDGASFQVSVSEGMEDLVRSYFGQMVRVTGAYDGKAIYPADIQPTE